MSKMQISNAKKHWLDFANKPYISRDMSQKYAKASVSAKVGDVLIGQTHFVGLNPEAFILDPTPVTPEQADFARYGNWIDADGRLWEASIITLIEDAA